MLCLGVCLGNREIGVALATREYLVRAHVVTLRKQKPDERKGRAMAALQKLIADYGPNRIAVVAIPTATTTPLVTEIHAWLPTLPTPAVYARIQRMVTLYDADAVRRASVPDDLRPTNRQLAFALGERFPALSRHLPSVAVAADGEPLAGRVPQRTNRERYVVRLFLAVAGAMHDLDEDLRTRLTLTASPLCPTSA